MKLRLLGVVCACLASTGQAASLSSAEFDWSTLTIIADGNDVTGSLVWDYQLDYIETGYIEGATSGALVNPCPAWDPYCYDIDPNTGWATSQNTNDGGLATDAKTSVSPDLVSASTEVNYTGHAESSVMRYGVFTAPSSGTYSFSVDYALSAEVNGTNSETGGGANSLLAEPYIELDIREGLDFINPDIFGFVFDTVTVDGFGTDSSTGTLTVTGANGGPLFNFTAGDTIHLTATTISTSTSYSSMPPGTVPVPPAIALFISGLGALVAFGHRKKSTAVTKSS